MFFKLLKYIRYKLVSPEKYARCIGVKIGKNNFIATKNFGTEPYLIKIGNNCGSHIMFSSTRMVEHMWRGANTQSLMSSVR